MKINNKTYNWEQGSKLYTEINFETMYAYLVEITTDRIAKKIKLEDWNENKKSYQITYFSVFGMKIEKIAKNQYKDVKK